MKWIFADINEMNFASPGQSCISPCHVPMDCMLLKPLDKLGLEWDHSRACTLYAVGPMFNPEYLQVGL